MRTYAGLSVKDEAIKTSGFLAGISEEDFEVNDELRNLTYNTAKAHNPSEYDGECPSLKNTENKEDKAEESVEDEVTAVEEETDEVENQPVSEAETETVAAELAEEAPILNGAEALAEAVKTKYRPSPTFCQKMLAADEIIQDRYDELKNYALRFKKLKSRLSKKFDSINQGRLQFVKLSVAGKTLKLYLNMDIHTTEPKFHCKDVSAKKTYVTVPVLLRIKSGRAVRYAKILIDQCAAANGLVENKKFVEVDAIATVEKFRAEQESSID